MFKKLKDKLAEEVKSSPQRIHQFAQAAQAAVTSASSSISDITNSDLFSIGDNDTPQGNTARIQPSPSKQQTIFQDVNMQSPSDPFDFTQEVDPQRQRRLSNSSFASDVSFRLPSYETPSTYHLQSDMEVSASEADERGFSGGPATLDRVTKEQLYAAYKRTQERYKKYRTQYGDLARHYKLLERENAKARSVLVETQDKALRRISELKEQCSLEQSAKAHLEKALRIELEEKNMKIETLNTKIKLLQSHMQINEADNNEQFNDNEAPLINLTNDNAVHDEAPLTETSSLNSKIEKMEQLLNKYKESLKSSKEKNSQLKIEVQRVSNDLENKTKQIQEFADLTNQFANAKNEIQALNAKNEELQNQINTFDFNKTKEMSTLEMDLQKANEEIVELRTKISVFNKREEEYAISLAENKLSIHKELESKEAEIKSLKDNLTESKKELQSLKIVITDYKNNAAAMEEEKNKLINEISQLNSMKTKYNEMETCLQDLNKKVTYLEQLKTKADEEYKCLQLQFKQETAEKMAMIDRNSYLEGRNTQLMEENSKKSTQINTLEEELKILTNNQKHDTIVESESAQLHLEVKTWKEKCSKLESEIQEERIELVKLQAEIEKLLGNHELLQTQNIDFRSTIANMISEKTLLEQKIKAMETGLNKVNQQFKSLRVFLSSTINDIKISLQHGKDDVNSLTKGVTNLLVNSVGLFEKNNDLTTAKYTNLAQDCELLKDELTASSNKNLELIRDLHGLRDENNNLKENLNIKENEYKVLNEKLIETVELYEKCTSDSKLLKEENEKIKDTLRDLESILLQSRTDLEDEKKRNISIEKQITVLEESKKELETAIEDLKQNKSNFNGEIEALTKEKKYFTDKINKLVDENKNLNQRILELQNSHSELAKIRDLEVEDQVQLVQSENKTKIDKMEAKNTLLTETNQKIQEQLEVAKNKISEMDSIILAKSQEIDRLLDIQASLEIHITDQLMKNENLEKNEKNRVIELEATNNTMKSEIENYKKDQKTDKDTIDVLTNEVRIKSTDLDTKLDSIKHLEETIRNLLEENISLKSEAFSFITSIKTLQSEINEVKQSHTEMEQEKNRLNVIIEHLEQKESSKIYEDKNTQTQTEECEVNEKQIINEPLALLENKWVLENKISKMSNTASLNLTSNELEDLEDKYSQLKLSHDTIKDENRRLQSDIEGLQTYLTKISKENSVLNDKLREVIATGEQSSDDQLSCDVKELRNIIQQNKEKINDLFRENSLLIEENLELKDQLQSQSFSKTGELDNQSSHSNNKEIKNVKEKLENICQKNIDLERRNIDLEQMNKSVNGSLIQLQDKNERLKISNEKLERRLDEALVSLRHLHSLQENTELEYLRNILYEYLTGSGTHSITLAKVLSAIVKFDDNQIQMVMQKEKERQGFLRQLGLL